MNGFLFNIVFVLIMVNLFASLASFIVIGEAYNILYYIFYIFGVSLIITAIIITSMALAVTLDESNQNGLSLLLQVGILITNILAIRLSKKVDYKRNVKPYLRIKF